MSYWSFEQRVSEDDALHYERKGMKWYQNIFGDKSSYIKKNRTKYKEKESKKLIKKIRTKDSDSINRNIRYQRLGILAASTIAIGAAHINYLFNTEVRKMQLNRQKRNIMIGTAAINAILEGKRIYQINSLEKQRRS